MVKRTPLEILQSCFSEEEWRSLQTSRLFKSAVANVKTMDDVERVSKLGDNIIRTASERGEHRTPPPRYGPQRTP